jgi:hypothetical protein
MSQCGRAGRALLRLEFLEDRWLPTVLHVGPGEEYAVPSQAAAVAQDGDDVQIDAGLYSGDVAVWKANNLTLEGVGGLAHLDAAGNNAQGKGTWVIQGTNTTVSNIEFSGAMVPDHNGAGIRLDGTGLTVLNCYFHDNEEGLLTGDGANSDILIAYSEFAHNGTNAGSTHNLYVGTVGRFTLLGSYVHDAIIGHEVKSNAQSNYILYNRIQENDTGTASYEIDLPHGGVNYIVGNVIRKGPGSENSTVVTSGEEGASNPVQEFYFINNTVVQDRNNGTYVRVNGTVPTIRLVNNIFAGQYALGSTILSGNTGEQTTNLVEVNPSFVDPSHFDYHLQGNSDAIDAGTYPGTANNGTRLAPLYQYVDQTAVQFRPVDGAIDIGAYEYVASASAVDAPVRHASDTVPVSDAAAAPVSAGAARGDAEAVETGSAPGNAIRAAQHATPVALPSIADLVFANGSDFAAL